MIWTILSLVFAITFISFLYIEFSPTLKAKRIRVAFAMYTTMGMSWKESWKYAKENVK